MGAGLPVQCFAKLESSLSESAQMEIYGSIVISGYAEGLNVLFIMNSP